MEKRVVITGTGILSPSGITNEEFFDNLINGRSGISKIDWDNEDLKGLDISMCGKIRNWEAADYLSLRDIKRLNINGQFITYCAKKAIEQSGLNTEEVVGFGSSADAYHVTAPHPEGKGAVISMEKALKMANINSDKIGYINAHGTGTYLNDKVETIAMKKVFGDNIYNIPVSSTKSMTGHLLGAAGGVEAIALLLPLLKGIIPPTINYNEKDPELDLDYVPNKARECKADYVMSNSLGFGGQNGSIILKKFV